MKAMVYAGPMRLELREVAAPAPGPGEVLVRVGAAGICGSEVEGVVNRSPFRVPPLIMGHEFGGVRADTGQPVVVNPLVSCLECDLCRRGQPNLCRRRQLLGVHRPGGFAELVSVPERNVHPAPPGISAAAAALVEPLANGVHALRLAADRTPATVGVFGASAIGLCALLAARALGIPDVRVADLVPERLEVADRLGASATGRSLEGEFDLVVDAVGAEATRRGSVELLRPGGTAVWIGMHGDATGFGAADFIRGGRSILASYAYTDLEFQHAIQLAVNLDESWVTEAPLEKGVGLFEDLMRGRSDLLKVQLVP